MVYLNPLPAAPDALRQRIAALEVRREARRALGRLSSVEALAIAADLRELRAALAVVEARRG